LDLRSAGCTCRCGLRMAQFRRPQPMDSHCRAAGFAVDRCAPAWGQQYQDVGFSQTDQAAVRCACAAWSSGGSPHRPRATPPPTRWSRSQFSRSARSLTSGPKAKSRARRESLKRLAASSSLARAPRHDLRPRLDLVYREPLYAAARGSQADPAHVREVANSITTPGFCPPILVGKDNLVLAARRTEVWRGTTR
jgi:hypothetical protein